ncbi:MAG: hypothetical protein K5640_03440 [Treponema sp.]|nr:hypothetical protein [Treponema sp.]
MGFIICAAFLLSGAFLFAEEKASDTDEKWVLSAVPFTFANSSNSNIDESSAAVAKNIPSLILEQISSESTRIESVRESLDQKSSSLRKERQALFLELSKSEKTRDALILQNYSRRKYQKLLKKQVQEIEEIHKKITANLTETSENAVKALDNTDSQELSGQKNAFLNLFKITKDISSGSLKTITLYGNDSAKLFSFENKDSVEYENKIVSEKINGLLSGTITSYGDYAAVTAELRTYPGGTLCASVTEVGLLSAPLQLAGNLSKALTPALSNKTPVELNIKIMPEEIKDIATVNIDGIVFQQIPDSIIADSGSHTLTFEAEGYRRSSVTYSFTGKKHYSLTVNMQEYNPKKITFQLMHPLNSSDKTSANRKSKNNEEVYTGVLSTDAINSFSLSPLKDESDILVDGKPVIAHFKSEAGYSSFFYIPLELLEKTDTVTAKPLNYDVSENIEKRRRMMYTAYSAFIISLPFSFYYYGTYVNKLNGNIAGSPVAADDVNAWRNKAMTSVCISTSLGILFGIELVRYLHSTNAVLPRNAKAVKTKP